MYGKLFALSTLVTAVAAVPSGASVLGDGVVDSCNVGSVQCCNQLLAPDSSALSTITRLSLLSDDVIGPIRSLLGSETGLIESLLAAVTGPIDGMIGLDCSPITVIGIGGNSCTAQPVCCSNNNFKGVVAIGCSPININL